MKIMISGLINIETTLKINSFPIHYYPIDYPFFGIQSNIAGVAYNIAKALITLDNKVELISFLGKDEEGERIKNTLKKDKIGQQHIFQDLVQTPVSVILYDNTGKRQIYCDLKNIQEKSLDIIKIDGQIKTCDIIVACNINFNRSLLKRAKELGKIIASDVQVLNNIEDDYNKEFMQYSDILFLSDEQLPYKPEQFLFDLKNTYNSNIIVIGLGEKGAMLYYRREDKMYFLEAIKTKKVVNTIGAGDALFSSFLNYYGKGYTPVEALKRAELFAAAKIEYNGASIGFSTEEAIEKRYKSQNILVHELG